LLGLTKGALFCLCLSAVASGVAEGISFESAGARFGMGSNRSSRDFYEAEAFADLNLPWRWNLSAHLHVESRLDLGVGWLAERSSHAALGEVGPLLVLGYGEFLLTLAIGSNATGLSRSDFETKDLGIAFQFTTHIGLNWDFAQHFRLGYRYQHSSNAGLNSRNPGLNLHMLGLSYLF